MVIKKIFLFSVLCLFSISVFSQNNNLNFGEKPEIEKVIARVFNNDRMELIDTISKKYHNIEFLIITSKLNQNQDDIGNELNNISIIELLRTENNRNWVLNSYAENIEKDFGEYNTIESIQIHDLWDNEYLLSLDYHYDNGRDKIITEQHFYLKNKKVLSLTTSYSRLEINNNAKNEDDVYSKGAEFGRTFKIDNQKKQIVVTYKGTRAYNEQLNKYMPVNKTEIYKLGLNNKKELAFLLTKSYNN
jgi:hypothetical protein